MSSSSGGRWAWLLAIATACAPEQPIDAQRGPSPRVPITAGTSAVAAGSGGTGAAGQTGATVLNPDSIIAASCAKEMPFAELLPSNLLFVVDRSKSMACNPPPLTSSEVCEQDQTRVDSKQPSKWELTSVALQTMLASLPETDTVGTSFFSNNDECGVYSTPTVALAPNTPAHRTTIQSTLQAIKPGGPTPLVGATILAFKHLHDLALSGRIQGNQYVVLITDGGQTEMCDDLSLCVGAEACTRLLIEQEVPRARAPGVNIRTFVIGVPGSEPARTVLSRIANAGGTGQPNCNPELGNCHFDMTKEPDLAAALQSALQRIAGQTLTCDLKVPKPKFGALDLGLVNVVYTPSRQPRRVIPQDTHARCEAGADGWQYNATNDQIRLCGAACTEVRSDPAARIEVVLGCPVLLPD